MKINSGLLISGLAACAGLTAIYMRGESDLVRDREAVISTFEELHVTGIAIQKDVLKSRGFVLGNYDSLVQNEWRLRQACERLRGRAPGLNLYGRLGPKMDEAIGIFCENSEKMLGNVEIFKSKNAIVRNSMFYLAKYADTAELNPRNQGVKNLVRLTFQFSFVRSAETKAQIESRLAALKEASLETQFLKAHASAILRDIDVLDELVKGIVGPSTSDALSLMQRTYQEVYEAAEKRAAVYRRILFGLCLALLFYTIYAAVRIFRTARVLAEANSELENRVSMRTSELNQSLRLISDQQAQMVSAARMSALGEMAGQAAHEINTPLGALLLVADLVGKKIDNGEFDQAFYRKQLDSIVAITTRMARIVSSMRKLSSGTQNEPMSEAGLRQLIDETLVLCEGRFKRSSVMFEAKMEFGDFATVHCYPSEVSQVLLNLLNNAHDAVKDREDRWVRLEVSENREKTVFKVIDSGPGVPKELHEKIFDARFTTKSLDHGTGFGLSISRKIAAHHEGVLTLDPQAANTTFVFEIPKSLGTDVLKTAS